MTRLLRQSLFNSRDTIGQYRGEVMEGGREGSNIRFCSTSSHLDLVFCNTISAGPNVETQSLSTVTFLLTCCHVDIKIFRPVLHGIAIEIFSE